MKNGPVRSASTRDLERSLVLTGEVVGLIASGFAWLVVSGQQPLWPLPGLYLLEALAASTLATLDVLRNEANPAYTRGILAWAAAGVLAGLVVMGAFSIGFLYAPVTGLIGVAAILSDRRQGRNVAVHAGIGLAAALIQAAMMLIVIRLL